MTILLILLLGHKIVTSTEGLIEVISSVGVWVEPRSHTANAMDHLLRRQITEGDRSWDPLAIEPLIWRSS